MPNMHIMRMSDEELNIYLEAMVNFIAKQRKEGHSDYSERTELGFNLKDRHMQTVFVNDRIPCECEIGDRKHNKVHPEDCPVHGVNK